MNKKFKLIFIIIFFIGAVGAGSYFLLLKDKAGNSTVDNLFGWKFPVVKFPSTGSDKTDKSKNVTIEDVPVSADGRINVPAEPSPIEGPAPVPEIPTCVLPQILVDNVCTDPAPVVEETPAPEVPPVVVVSQAVVRSVSSPILKGTFHSGVVPIIVTFNKTVVVSGTPQLILSTGTPSTTLVPLGFSFGNRLYFLYQIIPGNVTSALDYNSSFGLDLNGGSIKDINGNDVLLTLPNPGSVGSLSDTRKIVIETQ